jgi:SAM-dependent methyltransferase
VADIEGRLPEALRRALPLLTGLPESLDVSHGYLDLLGGQPPERSGPIQALWASGIGSRLYDHAQALARRMFAAWQLPVSTLNLRPGDRALDVGCGPGEVTAELGRVVGLHGLALGLDVSAPMLTRAVRAHPAPNVGFLRADALRLPLRDGTVNAITCVSVLQLMPDPFAAVGQMTRALTPGGHIAIMVPTVVGSRFDRFNRLFSEPVGVRFFGTEELADALDENGLDRIRSRQMGTVQWITARKPTP